MVPVKGSISGPVQTGLFEAAVVNNCDLTFLKLHRKGANVNEVNFKGETALIKILCRRYDIKKIYYLIEKGADLNVTALNGTRAVHYLAQKDKKFHLDYFIRQGADFNVPNGDGDYPFDLAFRKNPFGEVTLELERLGLNFSQNVYESLRQSNCTKCGKSGCSLLTRCMHYLHLSCITNQKQCPVCDTWITPSYRIEKTFSINSESAPPNLNLFSNHELFLLLESLIMCTYFSFETFLQEITQRNLFEDEVNFEHLHKFIAKACRYGRLDLVEEFSRNTNLLKYHNNQNLFNFACFSRNKDLICFLMEKGLSIDSVSKQSQFKPLQVACAIGDSDLFDFLLEKGADIKENDRNSHKQMDLIHIACMAGSLKIIEKLCNLGKDVNNNRALDSMTPLHFCMKTEAEVLQAVQFLLEKQAKLSMRDFFDFCPMLMACNFGYNEVFSYLKHYRLKVMKKCYKFKGNVLLQAAAFAGNVKLFRDCIQFGMQIDDEVMLNLCETGQIDLIVELLEFQNIIETLCRYQKENEEIINLLFSRLAPFCDSSCVKIAFNSGALGHAKKLLECGVKSDEYEPIVNALYQ